MRTMLVLLLTSPHRVVRMIVMVVLVAPLVIASSGRSGEGMSGSLHCCVWVERGR